MAGRISPGPVATGPQTISLAALAAVSSTFQQTAGAITFGVRCYTTSNRSVLGARFQWTGVTGGPQTVVVELWDSSGTKLDSATVSVSANGLYTCNFASSHAVAAYTNFTVSYRRTDVAGYCYYNTAGLTILTPPFSTTAATYMGPYLMYSTSYYGSGAGVYPVNALGPTSQIAAIDPILDVS